MGTLAKLAESLKENPISQMIREECLAVLNMINSVEEGDISLKEAVRGNKDPEVNQIKETLEKQEEASLRQGEARFDIPETGLDKDGYKELEDRVGKFIKEGVSISEEQAIKNATNPKEKDELEKDERSK